MRVYTIMLKRSAIADLDALRKYDATQIADAMERHLQHNPTKESKAGSNGCAASATRITGSELAITASSTWVDEVARRIEVLRVMHKDQTLEYYKELQR